MTEDEIIKEKIRNDPDFINCKKYGNSLKTFKANNPGEINYRCISRLLKISEKHMNLFVNKIISKLKKKMNSE